MVVSKYLTPSLVYTRHVRIFSKSPRVYAQFLFESSTENQNQSTSAGHLRLVTRAIGRRRFASSTEEYAKRNYANNEAEYKTVIGSLTSQRRFYGS
ncbi:Hypothetical predicted protein [Olea europaea subsp. europaea]|uniref:Uncharacterized protein n=1 Tax=Olea europaea subsp. europaea TaxID=158383 RepID=A0A8S0UV53_OLEEU|nr:Hypothetical predicted protein [Olea europaea subsp. europaea]